MSSQSDRIKGKRYFLAGNLPASIKSFTAVLEQEPDSHDILLARGAAYLKLSYFDKAVEDFSNVLDAGGDCERAFFLRGIANLNAGQFGEALADLNRALKYNSKRGSALLARGLALFSMGYHEEANEDFTSSYVLDNIVIDEFLEEYALSEALFNNAKKLFRGNTEEWSLLLTEDEMAKMEIAHY